MNDPTPENTFKQNLEEKIVFSEYIDQFLKQKLDCLTLEILVNNIPIMLVMISPEGEIVWINRTFENFLGWNLVEIKQFDIFAYCYPDPSIRQEVLDSINNCDSTWRIFKTRIKDGRFIDTSWNNLKLDNGYRIAIGQDISQQIAIERALQQSESLYLLIANNIRDLVCLHELNGDYIYVSPSSMDLLGYEPEEMIGKSPYFFIHPDDCAEIYQLYHEPALQGQVNTFILRFRTKSGNYIWLETVLQVILDESSQQPDKLQTSCRDVTSRIVAQEEFRYNALHNSLSKLPNRVFLLKELQIALSTLKQDPNHCFALLVMDLDSFKLINDSVGYNLGDRMLIAVAQRLKSLLDPGDFLAHLGGDEFALLLFDIETQARVLNKAQEILRQLSSPFAIDERILFTSASMGIVIGNAQYQDQTILLRDAEIATSRAKLTGKGSYQLYDQKMYDQVTRRLKLETELRLAMQKEEFEIYYQPIFCLSNPNQIAGFEALLRWRLPDGIRVSPAEFIPVTEDTGMIITLGQWVLRQSCLQLRRWQIQYPYLEKLYVSVNLSGRQLREQNLIDQIDRILLDTDCSGINLKLEITETVLIENADFVAPLLKQLKDRQIQLSLDDFGTGYSSLSYLNRFSVDTLKLDRSFIEKIGQEERNFKIVQSIISLAHKLGMQIIAEGVETEQQYIYLKALECDHVQGYYFAKPLTQQEATDLLIKSC